MDVNHTSLCIDIPHLEIQCLLHPEPQRINRPEVNRHPFRRASANDLEYLIARNDFRKSFSIRDSHLRKRLPIPFAGPRVKELEPRIGNTH